VLAQLGIGRAVLAGNALGGEVAWRVAAAAPQRVAALVLVDAAGPPFVPQVVPLGWRIARVPVLNRLVRWTLPRAMVAEGLHGAYGDPSKVDEALIDRYHALTLRNGNRQALVERLRQRQFGQDADLIDTVTAPTLILWGGRDRLIPPAVGEAFERRIRGSTRVVFPELGHVPHEEDPVATVAPVAAFLDRVLPAAGR
jgi:pimeloyl-ACP methyl ester carboxylesterase